MKKINVVYLLAILALPAVATATATATTAGANPPTASYKFAEKSGELKALAIGNPSFLKINVKGEGPVGTLSVSGHDQAPSGTLRLNLRALETGISLRDKHLKNKYLQVEKYPEAELSLNNLTYREASNEELPFKGKLKVKDVAKEVSGTYRFVKSSGDKYQLTAKFSFSLKEYPIGVPSFSGIEVADKVEVEITSQVERL